MSNREYIDDEVLIDRYKSGDEMAFDTLSRRYKMLISAAAHAYYLAGGSSEDLSQEGMFGLQKAILTFNKDKNVQFASYAKTCIKSAVVDALRNANTDKNRILNESVPWQDVEDKEDSALTPEEIVLHEEKRKLLRDSIYSYLTDKQKVLLDLYLQGMTYIEIADEMHKDVKYVDNTLQIIKRKIRKNINIQD